MLFNTPEGRGFLTHRKGGAGRRRCRAGALRALFHLQRPRRDQDGAPPRTSDRDDTVITVATDGATLYPSERAEALQRRFGGSFGALDAAEAFAEHLGSAGTDHMLDCTEQDRTRPHLQPRLLHVGRAAGHAPRRVRGPALAGVLEGAAPLSRRLGRADRRLQRPRRRRAVTSVVGFRCAVCGTEVDIGTPSPWRCPKATDEDRHHVLRIVRRPGPCRPSTTPTPSSRSAPSWRGRRSPSIAA